MGDLEQELSDDQAQQLGLDAPLEPAPQPTSGGEHHMRTTAAVKEPDGAVAPIGDGGQPELSDDEAKALGLDNAPPAPNPEAIQYVAQHGDIPKPDQAAEIIRYSAASGLPANLVAADLEGVKRRVDAAGVDWQKLAERQPGLAQYLVQNPHALQLVQGDTHNLGVLEWAWKAPFAAFMDAVNNQGTVGLQTLRAVGVKGLDSTIQQRLDTEKQSEDRFGPDYGATNLLTQGIIGAAKSVPFFAMDKAARVLGGLAGGLAGGAAGVETGPGAILTAAGGVATGQFVASGVFNTAEALGPMSWQLDHMKDENGQPINPAVANVAAVTGSLASGALMAGTLGLFKGPATKLIGGGVQKVLPGVAQAISKVGESAVVKWLAGTEAREVISKFIGRWGVHTAIGAGMMAANGAVTAATTEAAKGASGMDARWGNIADAFTNGGAQGFRDMWLLSAVPAVQQHMEDLGRARASAESVARLEASITAAKDSTTLEKSPEAFQQVMDMAAPGAKVYVPAERWQSYFQDKKLDPAQMAQAVGLEPERLTSALSTGGNLEIEASKFLAGLAKSGHADGLAMDLKSDPALLTAREFKERQDSEAKRMVSDATSRATELDSGKKAIEDFVVAQAKASGLKMEGLREGAKLLAESAATQALRLNVSMQEAARLMNYGELSVTGKKGLTPEHEVAAKAFREWLAPSASQQLKARLGTLSPENRARELYLDSNTGLPNATHFEDLNALEGETAFPSDGRLYANVGVAGTKFVNDSLDHAQGDLLYRAAANALHEAAPELNVSKPGGDFEFRVKDQAHLDEVLKKANELLPPELKPFVLTGGVGESRDKAADAHVELKKAAEAAGTRAPRTDAEGKALPPLGFTGDIKALKFPEAKVQREPHPELAKAAGAMTPEAYFAKAYVEPKTELLTSLGWEKVPRKRYVAAFDLKGLKSVNEAFGKEQGDRLIERFGVIARHYGGSSFDFAHLHGDEYAAQHDDPAKLQAFVDRLRRKGNDVGVHLTWPDGTVEKMPVAFRHGIGKGTYEAADAELNRRKKLEGSPGSGLAQAPVDLHGTGSGEGQAPGQAEDENLHRGPPGVGSGSEQRGGGPQVYPGSGRPGRGGVLNQEGVVPQGVLDARAFIVRMRDQEKASAAQAFLDYATGLSDTRPPIDAKLEKELARFGVVDPEGYGFDESGRSLERGLGGKKVFGKEPDELRRYRLMNVEHRTGKPESYNQEPITYIEGRPVTFEQAQRPMHPVLKQALGEHEERFRSEPNEHAMALTSDGQVLFTQTSGHPNRVELTPEQGRFLRYTPDAVFTHNHPSGSMLSADDLSLAVLTGLKEIRAVAPDGSVWRVVRPDGGWGYRPGSATEFESARKSFQAREKLATSTASWRMDHLIREAGGDPNEFRNAKGYSDEAWRQIFNEELAKHYNEFSDIQDLGWKIERQPGPGENLGREDSAGPHASDVRTFKQEPPGGTGTPRGEIRLDVSDSGRPRAFDIRILNGDKSTFAHEVAHFLSWSMHDLATSDLATEQTRSDYETLLKFAGYENADARLKATAEGGGKKEEERISHGFEQYLAEGKAPSMALARVFSRFKDWLLRIYKGTEGIQAQYRERYGQEIHLSDDVRQVFDRLLAQDEALKQATQAVGGTGELPEALAGMTPAQAEAYRKALADAGAHADKETADGGGERQKAMDAQREAFMKQTEAELDAKPVYRAWRYLQHGDAPEGQAPVDAEGKPYKLARGDFEREYGPDIAKLMPPGSLKFRGGVTADTLAPVLGFNSGDDLVNALKQATPRDRAISQGTQDKMDAAHGPELERATEAALSGVHNPKALEAAVMELRAMAKQVNPALERQAHAIDVDALRRNIDRMTGEKFLDQLNPAQYARTERKLAMEAAELWGKGEKEAAYDKREQRLVNKLLFMSERDAKRELEAAQRRMESPSDAVRANLGKADPAYRDVHDSILAAVGLAPAREGEAKGLDELLSVAERDGHEMGDWVDTVRGLLSQPQEWEGSLPVDKAREVVDAIQNIRHAADESLNVTLLGKKQALDDIRTAIASRTATVQPAVKRPAYGGKKSGLLEAAEMKRRGLSAAFQDIETIAEMMDGGTAGPAHDLLINSRLEARDKEVELIHQVLEPLRDAFKKVPKDVLRLRDQSVDVAHLLPPPAGREAGYVRSTLWSLFLNMGNEGNLQRLLDGNKWDAHNMRQAVGLLTEPELTYLQALRDTANSLFPELAKAYERRTGLKLEKVQATPLIINGKEYAGGYWPIRYDRDYEGNQGNRQEINDIKDLFPSSRSPTVTNSSTKARQKAVLAPLDLSWGVVPAHFAQVIHDVAYGDWVRQVAKVVMKPRVPNPAVPSFDKTATDFLGPERAKEFLPWLRDVASARADSNSGHVSDAVKGLGFLRSRFTAAAIMLNIPSSSRHFFDPWTTMADSEAVLPNYIAGAYLKVMNPASWGSTPEFALSKELAFRKATHDDNLREELRKMGRITPIMQVVTEVGFATHKWVDEFTTKVGFKAAYDQALANGATQEQAVQRADEVVRRSFPSTDIAEKPPILRTKQGWAAAVMFYGYASKMHNLRSRAFDSLHRSWNTDATAGTDETAPTQEGRAKALATVAAKMIGLGLVSSVGEYFAGRGPTKKEDEEKGLLASRAEWLGTETLLSFMNDAPPVIGPAIKATLLGHKTNIASTPELALIDHQLQRVGNLIHGKKKVEEDDGAAWGAAEALIGALGPIGQAHRTVPYLKGVHSGVEQPRGPLDFAAGVFYGSKKDQGANPLTDAQGVLSGQ